MFFCPLSDCCGFFRLHWLYYSPLVLSCQAPVLVAVFVFLCTPLCASRYRGLPPRHLPFRVICGLAVDGSASRSDLRAASPASLLLPLLQLVRRGDRAICVAEDSAPLWLPVEALFTCLIICCPNKPPLYPHLNPASPSWQYKNWPFISCTY